MFLIVDFPTFAKSLFCTVTLYSKTCVKRPLKNRQNKDLNDKWYEGRKYSRMLSILQYFWPAFNDYWYWKPIFGIFESGRFTQVYCTLKTWRDIFVLCLFCFFVYFLLHSFISINWQFDWFLWFQWIISYQLKSNSCNFYFFIDK